jgi:hypothetical protein
LLAEQSWPAAQAAPQLPQFSGSVASFVQRPPQSASPARQVAWQLLLAQSSPAGQTFPQLAQLFTSAVRLAQYVWAPVVHVV